MLQSFKFNEIPKLRLINISSVFNFFDPLCYNSYFIFNQTVITNDFKMIIAIYYYCDFYYFEQNFINCTECVGTNNSLAKLAICHSQTRLLSILIHSSQFLNKGNLKLFVKVLWKIFCSRRRLFWTYNYRTLGLYVIPVENSD